MTPEETAMNFVAAYERDDSTAGEFRLAKIAKTWSSILRANYNITGIVRRLMDELNHPPEDEAIGGWNELRHAFRDWAIAEEWWIPNLDEPGAGNGVQSGSASSRGRRAPRR